MFTLQELKLALDGVFVKQDAAPLPIQHFVIDSRKLLFTEESVFIAIKGIRNDGHQYLKDVYDAGIRNFIVEKGNYDKQHLSDYANASFLEVDNGILALQEIAALHRSRFSIPIVGITGSNGKTIVKEWLAHLLKDELSLVKNPKSYNSQIGVPLSVLQLNATHQIGFFEAGISEPNEMQKLEKIIAPSLGVFTILGDAHGEGFLSSTQKLEEKAMLFTNCSSLLYCSEQRLVDDYFVSQKTFFPKRKLITWSRLSHQATYYFETTIGSNHTQLFYKGNCFTIPFADEASIWNACTCLAFLLSQGYNIGKFIDKFLDLPVLEMRLQLKEAQQNCLLINDSYSADLGSLKIALEYMQQHASGQKRTVILSDFLESGKSEHELYHEIGKQLKANQIDKLIGIGNAMLQNENLFDLPEHYFYKDTASFIANFPEENFKNELILLKGARSFTFEKISKILEKKVHQTVFEINLNALVQNLNAYRNLLQPKVKVMAMVKAFSYGAGSYEIAKILNFNRVDYLTVAYADEGVVLRDAGIKLPIMVMNPEPSSFDVILQNNLEPEVYNFEILNALLLAADGEEVGVHIELDSGMKRLGFDANQLDELLNLLKENPQLKVRSVFTHLAASEDEMQDDFSTHQINLFAKLSEQICSAFPYTILRHCLNSGGISRFPNAQFDMVRLGIGLYGVNPTSSPMNLANIGTLKTVISQIRNITSEESIGYGRRGKLPKDGKIAIVAIGYADGLNRKLSNGNGAMVVNGKAAKIVGNICMDMTMVDVSEIDCKVGDEVEVFGPQNSILKLSEQIGTIPYEILTGVSQRVKRVYYYE